MSRWKPGQSGNPSGRPAGLRNKVTLACEALLDGDAETLTRKAIELAKAGDTVALRLCLERVAPVRKGAPVTLDVPDGVNGNPTTYARAILDASAHGDLTPDEASSMMGVVEGYRRALETGELMERLETLERNNAAK